MWYNRSIYLRVICDRCVPSFGFHNVLSLLRLVPCDLDHSRKASQHTTLEPTEETVLELALETMPHI